MWGQLAAWQRALLVGGVAFVGYCIYFDHKRRSDPAYREKVRARRAAEAEKSGGEGEGAAEGSQEQMQAMFVRELQLAQQLMESDPEASAKHFANAVRMHGNPMELINMIRSNCPPEIFALLVQELQGA